MGTHRSRSVQTDGLEGIKEYAGREREAARRWRGEGVRAGQEEIVTADEIVT